MLGYGGHKFQRTESLKVFLIAPMTHFRPIDDSAGIFDVAQLGKREGVADNILSQVFYAFAVSWLKPALHYEH